MPDYRAVAAQDARKYKLPVPVFLSQINQESGFDPSARSGAGAEGIAQIVPKYHPGVNPYDPIAALDYAARYDRQLLDKYGGDVAAALSVYNSGSPTAYKDPAFAKGQTYRYVRDILSAAGTPADTATAPGAATAGTVRQTAAPAVATGGQAARSPFVQQLLETTSRILGVQPLTLPITAPANPSGPVAAPTISPTTGTARPAASTVSPIPFTGNTAGVKPHLLAAVGEAAKAAGATAVRVTSGERSAAHNAQVGGVPRSNHLTGDAIDGYALVNGQWVPLGQLLVKTAGRYGLRSGDQPGFFNGAPDPVHVDDGANQR